MFTYLLTYLRQSTDLFREFEVGVLCSERSVLPVGFIDEEDAGGHHEADEDHADDGEHDGDLSLLSHLLRRLPGHVFVARPGVCREKKRRRTNSTCIKPCVVNPYTAVLAALLLGKRPIKVPNLKSLRLFFFAPLHEHVK